MKFKYKPPENWPECLEDDYEKIETSVILYRISPKKEFDEEEFKPQLFTKKPKHIRIQKQCEKIVACKKTEKKTFEEKEKKCCLHAGLSVFMHLDDLSIKEVQDMIDKFNLGDYIFKILYDEAIGILYKTPGFIPSHCDLYIFDNINISDFVEYYNKIEDN